MAASAKMPVEAKPFPPGQEHLLKKERHRLTTEKKRVETVESLEKIGNINHVPIILLDDPPKLPWFTNARLIKPEAPHIWIDLRWSAICDPPSMALSASNRTLDASRLPIIESPSALGTRVISLRSSLDITSFHFSLQPKHGMLPCDVIEWN